MVTTNEKLDSRSESHPRNVERGWHSQSINETGCHWLRISCDRHYLRELVDYVSIFYGEYGQDDRGKWNYDARYHWASKVDVSFDKDIDRSNRTHAGKITLEIPGSALDLLSGDDLFNLTVGLKRFEATCSRIDVFFDDYDRLITPTEIIPLIKKGDFSGFRKGRFKQEYEKGKLTFDECNFGRRGSEGAGKYLRVYDKELESNGENDCIRWEVEFSGKRADEVFNMLSNAKNIRAFIVIAGTTVGGVMTFVRRTGDKNISRLDKYEFWELILEQVGKLTIRTKKKPKTLKGMKNWIGKAVAPSLAVVRETMSFEDYMQYVFDLAYEGSFRLNPQHREVIAEHENTKREKEYINF